VLLALALSNQLDQKSAAERALPSAPAGTLFWAQELQDLDASYSSALMCIRIPLGPFQSAARLPVPEIALVFGGCNPFQEQWSRSITYQGAIGILCTAHDLLTFPGRLFLLAAVCAVATPPPVPAFHRRPPENGCSCAASRAASFVWALWKTRHRRAGIPGRAEVRRLPAQQLQPECGTVGQTHEELNTFKGLYYK